MTKAMLDQLVALHEAGRVTSEYYQAMVAERDTWVPACGGTETWTYARSGRRYLYVVNPAAVAGKAYGTPTHGWLDEMDMVQFSNPFEVLR